jgi:hypothetical protein
MRKRKIGLAGERINVEAVAGGNGLEPAPTRERRRGRAPSSRSFLPPERHVAIVGHASVLPCVHANEE